MIRKGIYRRQFMQGGGAAAAGIAAAASGAVLIAPDGAWAMSLSALGQHEGETLLQVSRQIYPHPNLGDMYYAKVVDDLDAKAKADAATATLLKNGVAALDKAMDVPFTELSSGNQLAVLTTMESTPFFQTVRGTAVVSLYNNPLVWRFFGYEGASFPYGGYIHRGFNDIAWLPKPPESASPAAG
ncbi:MAG: hypothetical protein M0002_19105 [Rhodospirillales bacterium]|nr:hypothetical protein [Rhodospirillales bacterium]